MEIKVAVGDIAAVKAGAIIVNLFEGMKQPQGEAAAADKALDGAISQLIKQSEIKGKLGEVTVIHSLGKLAAARVVVVGLGKPAELSLDKVRGVVAETARRLRQKGVETVATVAQGAGTAGITVAGAAQAITEGALLGLYTFRRHITREAEYGELKQLTIVDGNKANKKLLESGCQKGKILAEAANLVRDMVNEPANYMTPTKMAEMAGRMAKTYGLEITVLEREEMKKLGMGGLLGVSQESQQPPKFIILGYEGGDDDVIDRA